MGKRRYAEDHGNTEKTRCQGDFFHDRRLGGQIGIHEKTYNVELLRENYILQRASQRSKKGCECREIEIRVYIQIKWLIISKKP